MTNRRHLAELAIAASLAIVAGPTACGSSDDSTASKGGASATGGKGGTGGSATGGTGGTAGSATGGSGGAAGAATGGSGGGPTVNAASCNAPDVQSAIDAAAAGDTVGVPAGTCSWPAGGVTLDKAITLQGAGTGSTNIEITGTVGSVTFAITKQASGVTRIKGFTFLAENNAFDPSGVYPINVSGQWLGTQPVVFRDDEFTMTSATAIHFDAIGGLIFSHITFNGNPNDTAGDSVNGLAVFSDGTHTDSWAAADSMGMKDADGTKNIYIEDSTINGGSTGITDCSDGCRMVVRHNTFVESGGINSHGYATSPEGLRHFEIYQNAFQYPNPDDPVNGNINWYIWIRGGTGVIWGNTFDPLYGSTWGDKAEIRFTLRGAEDVRPQGTCAQVAYPVPHQLGQNNDGNKDFTDPIYLWDNTGTTDAGGYAVEVTSGWTWGNPCGFDWNTFFQWGRDGINTSLSNPSLGTDGGSVEGVGGAPKPGYTPYTYPHPLAQ